MAGANVNPLIVFISVNGILYVARPFSGFSSPLPLSLWLLITVPHFGLPPTYRLSSTATGSSAQHAEVWTTERTALAQPDERRGRIGDLVRCDHVLSG